MKCFTSKQNRIKWFQSLILRLGILLINCLLTLCVDTLVSYCSSFKDVFLHVLYAGLVNTTDMLQMSKAPVVFAHFILMQKKKKKNATIHFNVPVSQYVVERQFMWVCLCTQTQWVLNQAINMLLKSRFLALIQRLLQIFWINCLRITAIYTHTHLPIFSLWKTFVKCINWKLKVWSVHYIFPLWFYIKWSV